MKNQIQKMPPTTVEELERLRGEVARMTRVIPFIKQTAARVAAGQVVRRHQAAIHSLRREIFNAR